MTNALSLAVPTVHFHSQRLYLSLSLSFSLWGGWVASTLKTDCFKNIAPFFKLNEIVLFNLRRYFRAFRASRADLRSETFSFLAVGFNEFIALIKVLVSPVMYRIARVLATVYVLRRLRYPFFVHALYTLLGIKEAL